MSDDCFVRVNENKTKKSVYRLNVNQQNFVLIDDEQLYEVKLSRVSSSGITDACEVKGAYQKERRFPSLRVESYWKIMANGESLIKQK